MISMRKSRMAALILTIALLLAACGPSEAELTPTPDLNIVRTQAVSTFASSLTQTQIARPSPSMTSTPMATVTPFALSTLATSTVAAGAATTGSCGGMIYLADVTVPDNTAMTPGQAFTKTWKVQNTGTCAWGPNFKFNLVGGDAMGAQALSMTTPVAAGATTELSVPMVAPAGRTGTIQGTWRMSDDKGVFFGDSVTVVIVISGGGPTSTTGPATATVPSETPTP